MHEKPPGPSVLSFFAFVVPNLPIIPLSQAIPRYSAIKGPNEVVAPDYTTSTWIERQCGTRIHCYQELNQRRRQCQALCNEDVSEDLDSLNIVGLRSKERDIDSSRRMVLCRTKAKHIQDHFVIPGNEAISQVQVPSVCLEK